MSRRIEGMPIAPESLPEVWPALPFQGWNETAFTLHMWTQMVGKIRLSLTPWINHSWHVTLYLTARGLTTSPIPHGPRSFEIEFDFVQHVLLIRSGHGDERTIPLQAMAVAEFHERVMNALREMSLEVKISGTPNEIAEPIPFAEDQKHKSYEAEAANRFWRVLQQSDRVFKSFRSRFIGKCSAGRFRRGHGASIRREMGGEPARIRFAI